MEPIVIKKKRKISHKEYKVSVPESALMRTVIAEDFYGITEEGYPLYVGSFNGDTEELTQMLVQHPFPKESRRRGGMKDRSMVTNNVAANKAANDFCASAAFAREFPYSQELVTEAIQSMSSWYEALYPKIYKEHFNVISASGSHPIRKEWIIAETPFTSGIINKDVSLVYHKDGNNLDVAPSVMLVLKNGMRGGNLVLPEYDLEIKLRDKTMVIFNGGEMIHGVTPMYPESQSAYRFSLVAYTTASMTKCGSPQEELMR